MALEREELICPALFSRKLLFKPRFPGAASCMGFFAFLLGGTLRRVFGRVCVEGGEQV